MATMLPPPERETGFYSGRNREADGSLCFTSRHNDVSEPHGRLDVLLKGWLHKFVVLLDDAFNVPSSFCDVSAEPADQPDV